MVIHIYGIVWSLCLAFLMLAVTLCIREIRKLEEQLDLMLVHQNSHEDNINAMRTVLRSVAESQTAAANKTAESSQVEHVSVQAENLDVKLDKILEELDSLSNNATFGDMLAQGMSEMMNYTGIVGDRREV